MSPAYRQVAADLRDHIRNGLLPVGGQLPSLARLMDHYGVSITVVRMALGELRKEGLIVSRQGKGTFVRGLPAEAQCACAPRINRLESRLAELERIVRGTG